MGGEPCLAVLLLAVGLDLALGEPPNRWHPVAWIGRALARGRRSAPGGPPALSFALGAVLVIGVAGAAAGAATGLVRATTGIPLVGILVQAWLLKCAFSVRELFGAVAAVEAALAAGDLEGARRSLGRDLVSRPTDDLGAGLVASGAVESLAENFTDSVVAPICFFLVGGLPAVWAYRVINTADAMIGYRDAELEYLGKVAARLDDLLNLVPARVAAVLLVAAGALVGGRGRAAWRTLWRDAGETASPNAGWTMAAMAGAVGARLEKPGHYRLGEGALPDTAEIACARSIARGAAALALAAAAFVCVAFR
ncbi:MAG: adenosylcobinamide-phosphate synthase CbiB [Candidatus Rokubacteria bacterium]|nr:adenosylcobinamide-phosphate synthase CbiB [Candidatus Rokubacteria bacterium]